MDSRNGQSCVEETSLTSSSSSYSSPCSSSFDESLVFTTMCIIGLPVDVHVRNGSVFSGIFHTASPKGVVLKKAKMTKKGRTGSNVASKSLIETLVILSEDLVQVVAKGYLLPDDGVTGSVDGDESKSALNGYTLQNIDQQASKPGVIAKNNKWAYKRRTSVQTENGFGLGDTDTSIQVSLAGESGKENVAVTMLPKDMGNTLEEANESVERINHDKGEETSSATTDVSQFEDKELQLQQNDFSREVKSHRVHNESRDQDSNLSLDSQVNSVKSTHRKIICQPYSNQMPSDPASTFIESENQICSRPTSVDINVVSSSASTSSPTSTDVSASSCKSATCPAETVQAVEMNKKNKESKLNPGAKMFTPTVKNSISTPPPVAQSVTSVFNMSNGSNLLPVDPAQAGGDLVHQPLEPAKAVPYNNMIVPNIDVGGHAQTIVGNIGARTQPLKYPCPNQALPVGSTYLHPNTQAVMVGRLGQLVYVPVSHDSVPTAAANSLMLARPLMAINPVPLAKHQVTGNVPAQPFMHPHVPGAQQLYAAPAAVPLIQPPFVPGPNGFFHTNFS